MLKQVQHDVIPNLFRNLLSTLFCIVFANPVLIIATENMVNPVAVFEVPFYSFLQALFESHLALPACGFLMVLKKFCTDVSYFKTKTGWLYLSPILDLCGEKFNVIQFPPIMMKPFQTKP